MAELVRVNTRISSELNKWLDEQSAQNGMAKSTIIMLAVETYRREKETMLMMNNMEGLKRVLDEIEEIKKVLPSEK